MKNRLIAFGVTAALLSNGITCMANENTDLRKLIRFSTVLKIGEPYAYVNNYRVDIDKEEQVVPQIIDDRTMIPLRFVSESLNAEVLWDEIDRKAYITYDGKEIELSPQSNIMRVESEEVLLDSLPAFVNDRLLVPVRALAEAMDKDVYYNENGIIVISDSKLSRKTVSDNNADELAALFEVEYNGQISLYVSPHGNDKGDGSFDKPFKTIDAAKSAVRGLINNNENKDIYVYLRGGEYFLEEELLLDENDSPKGCNKVVWTAYKDEIPKISASKAADGWEEYKNGIYMTYIGEGKTVDAVYENGKSGVKARFPNMTQDEQDWFARAEETQSESKNDRFRYKEGSFPPITDTSNLSVYIFPGGSGGSWMWHMEYHKVTSLDNVTREVTLDTACAYTLGTGTHYYINGALEFLDYEGEFYYNQSTGMLYYMPYDKVIEDKEITYSVSDNIIKIAGSDSDNLARNIELSGFEILNNGTPETINYRKVGFSYTEAAGVIMKNTENIKVSDCNIHDVGGYGVLFSEENYNNILEYNRIEHTGYAGVHLESNRYDMAVANNKISNNFVGDTGRYNNGQKGISIYTYAAGYNHISHNTVANTTHMAIYSGRAHWRNYIEYNDVSNANRTGEDTGVIYVNYQCGGQVVRNNYVHDCLGRVGGFFAVYYDESGSEDGETKNNIIARMGDKIGATEEGYCAGGLLLKGKTHNIENNFFVGIDSTRAMLNWENGSFKATIPSDITSKNNVFYSNGAKLMQLGGEYSEKTITYMDKNLYWSEDGQPKLGAPVSNIDAWKKYDNGRFDQNSISENPCFMDIDAQDYRLRYDSPAYDLGIQSIDVESIGVGRDYRYTDDTSSLNQVFVNQKGRAKGTPTINLKSGETAELDVSAKNTKRQFMSLDDAKVTYSSDNPEVCTVDENGTVTAKGFGIAKISVSVDKNGTKTGFIYVLVDDYIEEFKLVSTNPSMKTQTVNEVDYVLKTALGQKDTSFIKSVEFSVDDSSLADVNNSGKVTVANKEGSFTVSADAYTGIGKVSASLECKAADRILETVKLESGETPSVTIGNKNSIKFAAFDSDSKEFDLQNAKISAVSYNKDIVEVAGIEGDELVYEGIGYGIGEIGVSVEIDGMTRYGYASILSHPTDETTSPWSTYNFGKSKGGMNYNEDGTISIMTSGVDFFNPPDDGTFIYRKMSADKLTVECDIVSVTGNSVTNDTAIGPMIRADLSDTSDYLMYRYKFAGAANIMTYRNAETSAGYGNITSGVNKFDTPVKLRLEKNGDVIKASVYSNGEWYETKEVICPMPEEYYVGVAGFSNTSGIFDEYVVTNPVITVLD